METVWAWLNFLPGIAFYTYNYLQAPPQSPASLYLMLFFLWGTGSGPIRLSTEPSLVELQLIISPPSDGSRGSSGWALQQITRAVEVPTEPRHRCAKAPGHRCQQVSAAMAQWSCLGDSQNHGRHAQYPQCFSSLWLKRPYPEKNMHRAVLHRGCEIFLSVEQGISKFPQCRVRCCIMDLFYHGSQAQ